MLQQVTHIEGLSTYEDHDLTDDTPPVGVQVHFDVVKETVKNHETGLPMDKNFVYRYYSMELGRNSGRRRIRDTVKYNDATQKWEILQLAPGKQSDIRKWPNEWNAFYRGVTVDTIGTPLSVLFPYDPSRVDFFKGNHVHSIERLANLTESDIQNLGMGARADCDRAKKYLKRLADAAPSIALESAMAQKDKQIDALARQVADLTDKLTQVLKAQLESSEEVEPVRRTRKPKAESVTAEA